MEEVTYDPRKKSIDCISESASLVTSQLAHGALRKIVQAKLYHSAWAGRRASSGVFCGDSGVVLEALMHGLIDEVLGAVLDAFDHKVSDGIPDNYPGDVDRLDAIQACEFVPDYASKFHIHIRRGE